MKPLESRPFWEELVSVKDELSLRELAQRFGVSVGAIQAALRRQGLSRRASPSGPRTTRHAEPTPEPTPEPSPAVEPTSTTARPRSKDACLHALRGRIGVVPDAEIAHEAGVSVRTVASYRARHALPAFRPPPPARAASRITPFSWLLGAVSDRRVAERAGVSVEAVRSYRARHGLPAAPSIPADMLAFRVVMDEAGERRGGVVLARCPQTAARLAATLPGVVVEVIALGPVLSPG